MFLRRTPVLLVIAAAATVLTGCSGKAAAPTDITPTSAKLRATVSCDNTPGKPCSFYFQYRQAGTTAVKKTAVNGPHAKKVANYVVAESVAGLRANTKYEYQMCGKGDKIESYVCVGPSGGSDTWQSFTTKPLVTEGPTAAKGELAYMHRGSEVCGGAGDGNVDAKGVLYVACGAQIVRYGADLQRMPSILLPDVSFASVTPSPDGKYLYVGINEQLRRLNRSATGTYAIDATWKADNFMLGGVANNVIHPRNLASDEFGNIYVSNRAAKPVPTRIVKYSPAGKVLAAFGDTYNDDPQNPYAFHQNRGITVSRDGRMIFVTSHLQGQVRRFDMTPSGAYTYKLTIGKLDTGCTTPGGLSAVSDIGIDPWDQLYIADTTCKTLKKFRPDGTLVGTIYKGPSVLHNIAVNRRGDVYAPEWGRFFTRAANNAPPATIPVITAPVIDTVAPVLVSATVPARSAVSNIAVQIEATDNVAVTEMRFADDHGNWGGWQPFAANTTYTLRAGTGVRGFTLQVRDAAGFTSNTVYKTTLVETPQPVVDTIAPVLASIVLPAKVPTSAVTVQINATDNVAVTQMRLANDDGNWGPWIAFNANAAHTLRAGNGTRGVFVQVRDAAGNTSASIYKTLLVGP